MTHSRKNEIFQEIFNSCLELQYGKAKDYASDADALSNFKSQDAEALGLSPFQKWGVYFGKQAMSILGAIGKNPQSPSTTSEPIEERINDAIIYLVLFKCLLEDLKDNKSEDNTNTYQDRFKEIQDALKGIKVEEDFQEELKKSIKFEDIKHVLKEMEVEQEFEENLKNPIKIKINKESDSTFIFTFSQTPKKLLLNEFDSFYIYHEDNTYYRYKCKSIRKVKDNVFECIIVLKRWWSTIQWNSESFDEIQSSSENFEQNEIKTEGTWFLAKS
jgi:hypothetical protein